MGTLDRSAAWDSGNKSININDNNFNNDNNDNNNSSSIGRKYRTVWPLLSPPALLTIRTVSWSQSGNATACSCKGRVNIGFAKRTCVNMSRVAS